MKMHIVEEKEDKLLHRKEVLLKADYEKQTPTKDEINKELINVLKSNAEVIKLDVVKQRYGERSADVIAYVYKDKESLKKVEIKNKKLKKKETKTEAK